MEYIFGRLGQEEDVLDFANYVFSMVRCPIDFKALLPKVYTRNDFAPIHALAMENGRIKGVLALLPGTLRIRDIGTIKTGFLGTMAVHPYARGRGIMRVLMDMIVSEGAEKDLDVLILNGRRHRYNYYGFERGSMLIDYTLNADCLKHAFREVDDSNIELVAMEDADAADMAASLAAYARLQSVGERDDLPLVLRSWKAKPIIVRQNGRAIGYVCIQGNTVSETALPDESVLPAYKKCLKTMQDHQMNVLAYPHETARIALLRQISENYTISDGLMLHILHWPKVLKTLLLFKHTFAPLEDGRAVIEIEGAGRLKIAVEKGQVTVEPTLDTPMVIWSHNAAVTQLFSPMGTLLSSPIPRSWLPLPFALPRPDGF